MASVPSAALPMAAPVLRGIKKFGMKEVFLPKFVITFIRPKPNQPPNLATFVVPLKFNKLDLRDYLYHVYNVEVRAVRSFINEQPIARKHNVGAWYRPQSQKMMIAELVKPFVWPKVPGVGDREDFDYKQFKQIEDKQTRDAKERMDMMKRKIPLPSATAVPGHRKLLKDQAKEILGNREVAKTSMKRAIGAGWKEVEENIQFTTEETVKGGGQ